MKDSLWSVDLFRCESIVLKSYWVMVVMDHFTRRIVGSSVEPADIDGVVVCRIEYLDQVFFWSRVDLQRKLARFARYYNQARVHSALTGKTPAKQRGRAPPRIADLQHFSWQAHCHGLFHTPVAA
jgi:transposase InsO family protein